MLKAVLKFPLRVARGLKRRILGRSKAPEGSGDPWPAGGASTDPWPVPASSGNDDPWPAPASSGSDDPWPAPASSGNDDPWPAPASAAPAKAAQADAPAASIDAAPVKTKKVSGKSKANAADDAKADAKGEEKAKSPTKAAGKAAKGEKAAKAEKAPKGGKGAKTAKGDKAPKVEAAQPEAVKGEATPNPNAMKFGFGRPVFGKGSASFENAVAAEGHPIPAAAFTVRGVRSVFAVKDFLTVTKETTASWSDLQPQLEAALTTALSDA